MPSSDRVTGALDLFLAELAEMNIWRADLRKELAKADDRHARLVRAIRTGIATLPEPEQEALAARLAALNGGPAAPETGTERTRLVMNWLRAEAPPVFTTAALRDVLERNGHRTRQNYAGTLLGRLAERGVVERVGLGTYRYRGES